MYFFSGLWATLGGKNTTVIDTWVSELYITVTFHSEEMAKEVLQPNLFIVENKVVTQSLTMEFIPEEMQGPPTTWTRGNADAIHQQLLLSHILTKHVEMDLKWNPDRVSHLGSSGVRVTDWNWRGNRNPNPLIKDDGELLMEEHLSPRKLKALAGVDDLQQVKALEMRVDTRETSLGNFGQTSSSADENHSGFIEVNEVGFIKAAMKTACPWLTELHEIITCLLPDNWGVAYNNISELSQLTWLDHLEVLDLEGNSIEDIDQMQYLRLCCKLSHLTVEGNLICLKPNAESAEEPGYNYRVEVKKLIPHLKYLDKIPANQTVPLPSKKMYEDCLIIKESIKEGGLAGDISWLDPAVSDMLFSEDDSSDLTHGLSQVICGNPAKALRERRQKLGPPAASPLKLSGLRTENLYGFGGGKDEHQENVSSEPRVWREQQKRCLQTGQQEQASQASKVILSHEEEGEDCSLTDSSEDELRKAYDEDLAERISLDSSCHSSLSKSSSGLAAFGSVFRAGEENADTQIQSAILPQHFSLFLRPIMDESPSGEINHQHPAVCSSTKTSEGFGLTCAAWPLTARAMLEPLPDSTTVTRTSQNRSPQP
ncbi:leucine-rich repeat-containing protein 56 [Pitangus sulphuratus]|nr:leucine-rich repeat-containing protein 56 [Pitangus sulphuratus]